jgi:hypothetical protein
MAHTHTPDLTGTDRVSRCTFCRRAIVWIAPTPGRTGYWRIA